MIPDAHNLAGRGEPPVDPDPRQVRVFAGLTAVVALVLFWPVAAFVAYQDVDYNNHLNYLRAALDGGSLSDLLSYIPHFLFYLLVVGLHTVGLSLNAAAQWVATGAAAASALAGCWLLWRWVGPPETRGRGVVDLLAALALLLVMPVNLLTPHNLYLGYIVMQAYHNPTILLLKPFALVVFWYAAKAFQTGGAGRYRLALVVVVAALSVTAKSSYALALLPALAVMAACQWLRRRPVNWLLLAIGAPQIIVLIAQAVLFQNTGGLIVAPLAVMNQWAAINPAANQYLLLKFGLSILFPAVVCVLYWRAAIDSVPLKLAWLTLLVGAAYMYGLAEAGERLGHANFTWSAQIAMWVLFAASLAFFIQQNQTARDWPRLLPGMLAFGLHLVSGLYWYSLHVNTAWMGDIITNFW